MVAGGLTNDYLNTAPRFGDLKDVPEWQNVDIEATVGWEANSPNHDFKGQNVLYADGHVEWQDHPYCGVRWDNIWTSQKTGVASGTNPDPTSGTGSTPGNLQTFVDKASYADNTTETTNANKDAFLVP